MGGMLTLHMVDPSLPETELTSLRAQLESAESELRRLRLTLDVLSPIDPVTGLLNRNGILEALQKAAAWLNRRAEPYGLLLVHLPGLAQLPEEGPNDRAAITRHIGALIAAAVRSVDEPGRLDETTFAIVLREFDGSGLRQVAERLGKVLREDAGIPQPMLPRFVAVTVRTDPRIPATRVLDAAVRLRSEGHPARPALRIL